MKEDLRFRIEEQILTDIKNLLNDEHHKDKLFSNKGILKVIHYVQLSQTLLTALIQSSLRSEIEVKLKKLLHDLFVEHHARLNATKIKEPYASDIVFSGTLTIFFRWIERDLREAPTELLRIIIQFRDFSPVEIIPS